MTEERFMKLVGKRIRQLRLQNGLTQDDMAHHFEYRYYQRIEHGDRNISPKILNRLSKALGVPALELFRFD
jgi:transcriptional regulator with XRE-family HTH domain